MVKIQIERETSKKYMTGCKVQAVNEPAPTMSDPQKYFKYLFFLSKIKMQLFVKGGYIIALKIDLI